MEDINLHFTGDFAAIALAHNLLSSMIDNHIHHGNKLGFDPRRISWRRVMDLSDRALRSVVVGLGGPLNGAPRQDGFDIIAASEIMAILCLSDSAADLKRRMSNIIVGRAAGGEPVSAADLGVAGSMAVLLKDAIKPNLVQTLENNPAFIHGGPFANIAHGCNSVLATRCALRCSDITVTEAGFGADLGAEKFVDIKCRKSGLRANAAVIVATVRALKYHGGVPLKELNAENVDALNKGLANLEKHLQNVTGLYGVPCVVAVNRFTHDTEAELSAVRDRTASLGSRAVVCEHWAQGGEGAVELAECVAELVERDDPSQSTFVYGDELPLRDKVEAVARKVYGLDGIIHGRKIGDAFAEIDAAFPGLPVCIAKTQYSFTAHQENRALPRGDLPLEINELRLMSGAEFVTAICGSMMVMPGLPADPAACHIDISEDGVVSGLF
jgi:formate--tetrahydrofolate ligase